MVEILNESDLKVKTVYPAVASIFESNMSTWYGTVSTNHPHQTGQVHERHNDQLLMPPTSALLLDNRLIHLNGLCSAGVTFHRAL